MNTPTPENPKMLDKVLAEWQTRLKAELDWLNYSCGRVVEMKQAGKPIPAIYVGGGDYKSVMPDESLGNYSFFDIAETYKFASWSKGIHSLVKVEYGLVFWMNLKKMFAGSKAHELETVKAEILEALTEKISLRSGAYNVQSITEGARGVFAQYAGQGYNQKYLMYPYGAIRFKGQITFNSR